MNNKILLEKMKQIQSLTEFVIVSCENKPVKLINKSLAKPRKQHPVSKLIRELIDRGFFRLGKTDTEVVKTLKQQALHVRRGSVATALMRLVRNCSLVREGDGQKNNPWKYRVNVEK